MPGQDKSFRAGKLAAAIEGWLLGHYEDLTRELCNEGHHVYEIEAHQPRYRLEGQILTADQVVASLHERTPARPRAKLNAHNNRQLRIFLGCFQSRNEGALRAIVVA
jgi:hypothetical protein